MAIAWCAFKLQDYNSALSSLNDLVRHYPNYYNLEEAHFVTGQCYLKLGYYDFAIREYDEITKASSTPADFLNELEHTKKEVGRQEKRLEDLNTELLVLEAKLLKAETLYPSNGVQVFVAGQREMQKNRDILVLRAKKERRDLEKTRDALTNMKKQLGKGQILQDWRAYAEYGKARALYLKSVAN